MAKYEVVMPNDPDYAVVELEWAVVCGGYDSKDVIAIFKDYTHADRFRNDVNGRSFGNLHIRQIRK